MLGTLFVARAIGQGLADAMRHVAEYLEGRRRRRGVQERARPGIELAVGIAVMRRDVLLEVGIFLGVVEERIEIAGIVRRQRERRRRLVIDDDVGIEDERISGPVEGGNRNAVAEHV